MSKEFKAFPKIEQIGKVFMSITQKIHGTNAQIVIYEENGGLEVLIGSRTRWITPEDDNYGFASFIYANKAEFIEKLGIGVHHGEWAGPGINSGEGLQERTFILFDFHNYPEDRPLPPQTKVVPLLYKGGLDISKIETVMAELKETGSRLVPGFMRPEGVVVSIAGNRYKKVFQAEETAWKKGDGTKDRIKELTKANYDHLLQPIRLEKLLSKDERYVINYPESLPEIVKAYFEDLSAEGQIPSEGDEHKAILKASSREIFNFIRTFVESK